MKQFISNNMHTISASNSLILIDNKSFDYFYQTYYFDLIYYLNHLFVNFNL